MQFGSPVRIIATGEEGTRLPLLGDAHVHLGLTDPRLLLAGGIGRVQELGWVPHIAAGWRADALARPHEFPEVSIAGAFVTAPCGYPSDREWAPAGAVREVRGYDEAGAADILAAVAEQRAVGASVIKITLNADAGPVFDDATLAAVVGAAHETGMYVVAHVEGVGQCARAIAARVDVLAHTPFSEAIDDLLLEQAAAQGQSWMSTLDIHGYGTPNESQARDLATAVDNARRFVALRGSLLYGTDLGNGKMPVGVNAREVRALIGLGLSPDEIIIAMTSWWGPPSVTTARVTFVPGAGAPQNFSASIDFSDWISHARVVDADELENV